MGLGRPCPFSTDTCSQSFDREKPSARTEIVYRGPLIAPVSEGQEVGFTRLTIDGKVVSRVPVITGGNVAPSTDMWRRALDSVMFMTFGG
jgi:hypothetical protein